MEDAFSSIDALLVPIMMELNVAEGMERAMSLVNESRESKALCKRLLERLEFLRNELKKPSSQGNAEQHSKTSAQFAKMVGLFIHLLKKFAQKKLLQRLATSRALREQVRELHAKIDDVFTLAGFSNTHEMVAWKQHEAEDIAIQLKRLDILVQNPSSLTSDLSGGSLEEALTEIKFEIDSRRNPKDFVALLERALQTASGGKTITSAPSWYIRREDVVIGEEIDVGSFGAVHKAKLSATGTEVMVKQLFLDGPEAQKIFLREADIWHRLSHSNIIKMYGGCYVGKPLFFVSEFAKNGNFADYFDKPANKSKLWRLFHQAAQGLYHLHSKGIIHANIKCSNILVGNDGQAKLSDFSNPFVNDSTEIKTHTSGIHWKAPECLLNQGVDAYATKKSDVYSLGMSIIEAKIGGVPWGVVDGGVVIDNLADGITYLRPEGVFTNDEWELIQAMIDYDPEKRITLARALELLEKQAYEEEQMVRQIDSQLKDPIQDEPSLVVIDEEESEYLQRVSEFIQHTVMLSEATRDNLLRHLYQVKVWRKQEETDRLSWEENAPTTAMCNECGDINPLDSPFCCECGSLIDAYRSREEAAFRFVVLDVRELEAAIQAFEAEAERLRELEAATQAFEAEAERQRSQTRECPDCVEPNPSKNRFCGFCGSRFILASTKKPEKVSVRIVLLDEIDRLNAILVVTKKEEARLAALRAAKPKLRACSRCGEMNDAENVFCCECGTDIEVIARHVL